MTAEVLLARWVRPARRRAVGVAVLGAMPAVIAAGVIAWRMAGWGVAAAVLAIGLAMLGWWAGRVRSLHGMGWAARRLDGRRDDMEDSAGLLLCDPAALGPLQRLQRARVEARLASGTPADLCDRWPVQRLAIGWGVAAAVVAVALMWPGADRGRPALARVTGEGVAAPGAPRLIGQRLRVIPPGYTGLAARDLRALDARVPEESHVAWTLRFAPQPARPVLSVDGGRVIALVRDGEGDWRGAVRLFRSILYRVQPVAGTRAPLHRLEMVADRPPRVRMLTPAEPLVVARAGQRRWALVWEASDDHRVAPFAELLLTVVAGDGEQVSVRERRMRVAGAGGRVRRFAVSLDLAGLGLSPGSDLIARLVVADTRPDPQRVRAPAAILRWPAAGGEAMGGLEAVTRRVMPAYFRSQRQIIFDAEQLLRERRRLASAAFLARSDAIGVDQRLLRLRYGQFLGEEAEGGPHRPALPTADAEPDEHGHAEGGAFGEAGDVTAEYGHSHDHAEAATLIDPDTKALLKQALGRMWQSELHLRQGEPARALPEAYAALRIIKQVQQATRIFLARVGPQLPPVDLARRMTGKRDGATGAALPLAAVGRDGLAEAAWDDIGESPGNLAALDRWLRSGRARVREPLKVRAAIDAVRREPGCARCRETLRALVWPALPRPAARIGRRGDGGLVGRRYLEAIR